MAQEQYSIRQGESKRIVVEVKDKLGANFPLTGATQIKAKVYIQGQEGKLIYALNPGQGENACFINVTDNYKLDIPMDREETKLLNTGILLVDVLVKKADATMIDGDGVTEFAPFVVGAIEKGYMKDETI